jgi:hypothetical protein
LSEFVLNRKKDCDISKQTKITAFTVSCMPFIKHQLRWEAKFSTEVKMKKKNEFQSVSDTSLYLDMRL